MKTHYEPNLQRIKGFEKINKLEVFPMLLLLFVLILEFIRHSLS